MVKVIATIIVFVFCITVWKLKEIKNDQLKQKEIETSGKLLQMKNQLWNFKKECGFFPNPKVAERALFSKQGSGCSKYKEKYDEIFFTEEYTDGWGKSFRFDGKKIMSSGNDLKFGTDDDIVVSYPE